MMPIVGNTLTVGQAIPANYYAYICQTYSLKTLTKFVTSVNDNFILNYVGVSGGFFQLDW
jgi:hypothetical protein